MKITFLGTSAGIPTKRRNVTAIAVQPSSQHKGWWLIDCGEGTQHQLLHTPFSINQLTTILITHLHGDHCYGLPGLLATRALQGGSQNQPLTLIGPTGIKPLIEGICLHTQLYLNFPLNIIEIAEPTSFTIDQHQVDAIEMDHNITSYGYLISPPDIPGHLDVSKASALGIPPGPIYQQLKQGKIVTLEDGRKIDGQTLLSPSKPAPKVLIAGDNANPQRLLPWLTSASLLIHESTLTEPEKQRLSATIHHSTAAAVAQVANEAKLNHLILTHFSARYGEPNSRSKLTLNDIQQEACEYYNGNLQLAQDWQQYTLTPEGKLLITDNIRSPQEIA